MSNQNLRMLKRKEVEAVTGLSRSSIYLMMEKGLFPRQIKLSERSVAWIESEINEFLESRISASRQGKAE